METILPMEMVSQISGSVSFAVRFMVVVLASSVMVIASSFATGAELEQAMRMVAVAVLLVAFARSCAW